MGQAGNPTVSTIGVEGVNFGSSNGSVGVLGGASAATGQTFGVAGDSASSSGIGVRGEANSTSGETAGLEGDNVSSSFFATSVLGGNFATTGQTLGVGLTVSSTNFAAGVLGLAGLAKNPSGATFGVEGISFSPVGIGAFAESVNQSTTASLHLGLVPSGAWGDTGQPGGVGVVATADDGFAVFSQNNSPSGFPAGVFENLQTSRHNLIVREAAGSFGICFTDTDGNLNCSGSKSAVVPVENGQRQVALYAMEAPQNWFEDFGSGQLAGGAAAVTFDPTFAQTVDSAAGYHVFLTPEGDCQGLYVSHKAPGGFEVHELG